MPTYDYRCKRCEHTFEHFQNLSEAVLKRCPACGKQGLERLFGTGIGVVFKGSGFYETDYKRKDRGGSQDKTSSSADGGSQAGTGKSEASGDTGQAKGKPKTDGGAGSKTSPQGGSKD